AREPVERAAVQAVQGGGPVVGEVAGEPVGALTERYLLAEGDADVCPLDAPVLEHHVHDALDRPPSVDARGSGGRAHARHLAASARARVQGRAGEGQSRAPEELASGRPLVRDEAGSGGSGDLVEASGLWRRAYHGRSRYQGTPATVSST